jgi:predicted nucleic acid-binding protein
LIVVDTSAVLKALLSSDDTDLALRLAEDEDLRAPHLLDVELLHVLRRLERTRVVSELQARAIRRDFADMTIERYPHEPLSDRIWQMRSNLTAYDASFVALSELLDVPLITCDARLAGGVHRARVEVYRT